MVVINYYQCWSMRAYTQHVGKVVDPKGLFTHVMAISLNPKTQFQDGLIRCITSREGGEEETHVHGQIDRSALYKIKRLSSESYEIQNEIHFQNERAILDTIHEEDLDFIGFEDPDIWLDEATQLLHVYFTIPLIGHGKRPSKIHLGHAVGTDLEHLEMTAPALLADAIGGAKEVSIAPLNKEGFRYNLVESSERIDDTKYSVVRQAIASDMGQPWKFGDIVLHPRDLQFFWIAGHASPGPLFPETFLNVGTGKRVGVMNGCEANKIVDGKIFYGTFSVGLFIYNFEEGKIEWVSSEPYIEDTKGSKIRAITFASQFVETKPGEGILYAHVNDSFVRAYTLEASKIIELLPKEYYQ